MLNNIKDPELTQKFFGFVNPNKTKQIIKYNKNIQGNIQGKMVKECDADGKLKYEGEVLGEKRNGKGREYYKNGQLMFEGEFKNGKRWNGRAYDPKGNAAGELVEGNGLMKEYDYASGVLIFDGQYFNGERKI